MGADDVIIAQAPEKPGSMMVLLDATRVTLRVRGHFDVNNSLRLSTQAASGDVRVISLLALTNYSVLSSTRRRTKG